MTRSPLVTIRNGVPSRGMDNTDRIRAYKRDRNAFHASQPLAVATDLFAQRFELGIMLQDDLKRRRSRIPARTEALAMVNAHARKQRANAAAVKSLLKGMAAPARHT